MRKNLSIHQELSMPAFYSMFLFRAPAIPLQTFPLLFQKPFCQKSSKCGSRKEHGEALKQIGGYKSYMRGGNIGYA